MDAPIQDTKVPANPVKAESKRLSYRATTYPGPHRGKEAQPQQVLHRKVRSIAHPNILT